MTKHSLPFILLCWALPAFDSYAENFPDYCGNIKENGSILTACCPGDKCCVCNNAVTDKCSGKNPDCYFSENCNEYLENCASKRNQENGFTCYTQQIDRNRCSDADGQHVELWFQSVRWSRNESYHGVLVCSTYKLPTGNWSQPQNCSNGAVVKPKGSDSTFMFTADCKDKKGKTQKLQLNLRICDTSDVNYQNGKLTCTSNPSKTKCTSVSSSEQQQRITY